MHAEHRPDRQRFLHDIRANRYNRAILDAWDALELPDAWLVAGCLFQTVWNLACNRAPEDGIKDYDIFYFDGDDLSAQAEMRRQAHVDRVLGPLGAPVETRSTHPMGWRPSTPACSRPIRSFRTCRYFERRRRRTAIGGGGSG